MVTATSRRIGLGIGIAVDLLVDGREAAGVVKDGVACKGELHAVGAVPIGGFPRRQPAGFVFLYGRERGGIDRPAIGCDQSGRKFEIPPGSQEKVRNRGAEPYQGRAPRGQCHVRVVGTNAHRFFGGILRLGSRAVEEVFAEYEKVVDFDTAVGLLARYHDVTGRERFVERLDENLVAVGIGQLFNVLGVDFVPSLRSGIFQQPAATRGGCVGERLPFGEVVGTDYAIGAVAQTFLQLAYEGAPCYAESVDALLLTQIERQPESRFARCGGLRSVGLPAASGEAGGVSVESARYLALALKRTLLDSFRIRVQCEILQFAAFDGGRVGLFVALRLHDDAIAVANRFEVGSREAGSVRNAKHFAAPHRKLLGQLRRADVVQQFDAPLADPEDFAVWGRGLRLCATLVGRFGSFDRFFQAAEEAKRLFVGRSFQLAGMRICRAKSSTFCSSRVGMAILLYPGI